MHFWVLFDFTFLLTSSFIFPGRRSGWGRGDSGNLKTICEDNLAVDPNLSLWFCWWVLESGFRDS
ncbi:hypothetical protein NC653_003767 [Populus alba x Populus x berolinensis]|uniref:Secreted protein n=1 Tax=Populus alba x Populus x berolinensis TaxID=444605 RepID=A0AAD6WLI4_9ROSI|nr:hypothetical protein NC653_003767 [Populus alba x Populus x berolinensis]